jgi:hypothetical protein
MQKNGNSPGAPRTASLPELDAASYRMRQPSVRPEAPPAPQTAAGLTTALSAVLDRLEKAVSAENKALEARGPIAFADINRQKSQSLLEVTRLSRSLPPGQEVHLKSRVATLRDLLARNHRLLGFHLEAVREVSDLMLGMLSNAESDGTYGQNPTRRGTPA